MKELKKFAEDCQLAADEITYKYLKEMKEVSELSLLQSHCDFNLFWIVGLSPVLIHSDSIDFLIRNQVDIKRKFTIKELFDFDTKFRTLKLMYEIETLKDYKDCLKKYEKEINKL